MRLRERPRTPHVAGLAGRGRRLLVLRRDRAGPHRPRRVAAGRAKGKLARRRLRIARVAVRCGAAWLHEAAATAPEAELLLAAVLLGRRAHGSIGLGEAEESYALLRGRGRRACVARRPAEAVRQGEVDELLVEEPVVVGRRGEDDRVHAEHARE